jgi:hypothetical protein
MWESRRLPTLWATTTCYRDSFTFYMMRAFSYHDHRRFRRRRQNSPFWAIAFLRKFCQICLFVARFFQFISPRVLTSIVHSIFPSQFRPSSDSSAFWFSINKSFRGSLLVLSNGMTSPFQPTHDLIHGIQFVVVFYEISTCAHHTVTAESFDGGTVPGR